VFPSDYLFDDDENSVSRKLRLLLATHEQELKELQRKYELFVLEIKNPVSKDKGHRDSTNSPSISPRSNGTYQSQILKNEDHRNRHYRQWKLECQNALEDVLSMEQCTKASNRTRISGKYSPRSSKDTAITLDKLPMSSQAMVPSLPCRPANQKSAAK